MSLWLQGRRPRYRYKHILMTSSVHASGINSETLLIKYKPNFYIMYILLKKSNNLNDFFLNQTYL